MDATARNFQIIGEAAKKIPPEIRDQYPHIPWREMAGFRDKIVHDYDGLNYTRIWHVMEKTLPGLLDDILAMPVKREDLE
jgi:uncharacterized protein with HEPN domain